MVLVLHAGRYAPCWLQACWRYIDRVLLGVGHDLLTDVVQKYIKRKAKSLNMNICRLTSIGLMSSTSSSIVHDVDQWYMVHGTDGIDDMMVQ